MGSEIFTVWANDVDLRSLDFWVEKPAALFGANRTDALQPLLGRAGSVVIAPETVLDPLNFTLTGRLICSSADKAALQLRAIKDLFAGTVELRAEPESDQILRVRAQKIVDQPQGNMLRGGQISIDLLAPDPLRYDRVPTMYVLPSGVPVPLEPGTAPSGITLILFGPMTNPTIDLLTPSGAGAQQMVLTGTLATNDSWEIDPIQQEIVAMVSGVRTPQPGILTDSNYLVLDPLMGTGDPSGYPQLRITGGYGLAIVRRAWL